MPGCLPPQQPAPHAGRYHAVGDPWPLYACLDEETMWAEWAHATEGSIDPADDPRWVCELEVDLAVLDLRDAATMRALRVTSQQLVAPWSPEQPNPATLRVAAAASELGVDAVIVPSAARSGGWNIAVLPPGFHGVSVAHRRRRIPHVSG